MIDKVLQEIYQDEDCGKLSFYLEMEDFLKHRLEENTALGNFEKAEENKYLIKLLELCSQK